MKTIRLQVGNISGTTLEIRNIAFLNDPIPVNIVNAWDDEGYHPSTLMDISVVMRQMVGQGVTWQLAEELSKKIGGSQKVISEALFDIFREYEKLSDDEAIEKYDNSSKLYDPIV
jgi:hypothetical protein